MVRAESTSSGLAVCVLTLLLALALAASIKLYPVLFAAVFLMAGYRKAFVSFLVGCTVPMCL